MRTETDRRLIIKNEKHFYHNKKTIMLTGIKKSYICAGIPVEDIATDLTSYYIPKVGDVAIFEVQKIGKHTNIQGEDKRLVSILPGDRIMAAFGTRYATEQFEGYVPETCQEIFHILGAGGTVGIVHSAHKKFENIGPTVLKIVGYAVDRKGTVVNTKWRHASRKKTFTGNGSHTSKIILSVGSSMDSGKTTTAAYLVNGIKRSGKNVAFIKLTGTVYTKDTDLVYDLGADAVANFGDYGFPSTYMCSENELLDLFESLVADVSKVQPEYIVIEIADGIYQRETKMLLTNRRFMSAVDEVVFSGGDSLSAVHGVEKLQQWGIEPIALSGLFTISPLLVKEVKENCDTPVFNIQQLSEGALLPLLGRRRMAITG
jgi:hypothetical protein